MIIDSFDGINEFLSNFYILNKSQLLYDVEYPSIYYNSVEAAFQAAKSKNYMDRLLISKLDSPGKAKRQGRALQLREDWESVKDGYMKDYLLQKFSYKDLKEKLLNTGDAKLIEGNNWGDTYWGVCNGIGENRLGILLMEVRAMIKSILGGD